MQKKQLIATGFGIAALVIMTATASALITRDRYADKPVTEEVVSKTETNHERVAAVEPAAGERAPVPQQQPTQQAPACDDGNIAGTVLGGAAGGIIGSQIGDGNGQAAATIAGVAGGALLGREYIPTQNITCR